MQVHDSGYKRLFTNRTLFRDLVRTFVEEQVYLSREEPKMLILESMHKADGEIRRQAEGKAEREREIAHAMTAHYPPSELARLLNSGEDHVLSLLADAPQA